MAHEDDAAHPAGGALRFDRSRELYERARDSTPGGVHTNIRLTEQPFPLFFASGRGGHLIDVDGNDLIDLVCGNGPLILGHSPEAVIAAVHRQIDEGLVYAGQSRLEVEAAELVSEHVPCAERVRFSMTGTEAMQAAIRIARAATGRQKLLLFQGHYDGWADSVLWNVATPSRVTGPSGRLEPVAESAGIESRLSEDVVVAQWNDADVVRGILDEHGHEIAAVIMEPVMGNSGVIEPEPGYLDAVRDATRESGSVLIFDEVITGFRIAAGGAQARYGVVPDLAVFGKAMGAGFPVAAVVGRAELLDDVGTGRVMHAGTFNSNPVGVAAVIASLAVLTDPAERIYERLEERGTRLMEGLSKAGREAGAQLVVQGLPMIFSMFFTSAARVVDHEGSVAADASTLHRVQLELIERGVRMPSRGMVFLSAAHTDDDIDGVIEAFGPAVAAALADPARSV